MTTTAKMLNMTMQDAQELRAALTEREERIAAQAKEIEAKNAELGAFRSSVTAMREQLDEFVRLERGYREYIDFLSAELSAHEVFRAVRGNYSVPTEKIEHGVRLRTKIGRAEDGSWVRP